MRKSLILTFIVLVGLAFPNGVLAMEAGGKAEILWSGVSLRDGEFERELTESVNLELFVPPLAGVSCAMSFWSLSQCRAALR